MASVATAFSSAFANFASGLTGESGLITTVLGVALPIMAVVLGAFIGLKLVKRFMNQGTN